MKGQVSTFLLNFLIISATSIKLPDNYDPSIRPNDGAVADYIKVSIQVLSIRDIDERNNEINVDLIIRKQWMDSRLSNLTLRDIILSSKHPEIWVPDFYIRNSGGSKRPQEHSTSLRLSNEGSVNHNERLSVRLNCPMTFVKFPFDTQECSLTLSSYGYTRVHLDMIWHGLVNEDIPVFDSEFTLSNVVQSSRNVRVKEGEYAHLILSIFLTRSGVRYVFRVFLPTILLSLFSYGTLYMQDTKSRRNGPNLNQLNLVSLAVNSLMVLLVVFIGQINSLHSPQAATVTAFDVWMLWVGLVVFLCFSLRLLKIITTWTDNSRNKGQREMSVTELTEKSEPQESLIETAERYLRLSIPVVLVLFLVVYFAVYFS
ncbi:unnamed protein product [Allacma fusca]|uniref:Neurotransmitter-gated ion-channel ligand-binding domain-containing protein n=1 Tax=Allacma fusca TaxID=39272 RepID=A0A8J2KQC9_9HEXA|nr:unnamed protein product [Allacma fusca]